MDIQEQVFGVSHFLIYLYMWVSIDLNATLLDGTYWANCKAFLLTEHELLGIFFAHNLDPFCRRKRLLFLLFIMMLLLVLNRSTSGSSFIAVAIVTSIVLEPIKLLLKLFIECPCVRRESYFWKCCCHCCRANEVTASRNLNRANKISWVLLCLCNVVSFLLVLLVVVDQELNPPDDDEAEYYPFSVSEWIFSQLLSMFCTSPLFGSILCNLYFESSKRRFLDIFARHFPEDAPPVSFSDVAYLVIRATGENFVTEEEKNAFYYNFRVETYATSRLNTCLFCEKRLHGYVSGPHQPAATPVACSGCVL